MGPEKGSIVPPLNAGYTDSNPLMFCNLARENSLIERCLYCEDKSCRHAGTQTTYVK